MISFVVPAHNEEPLLAATLDAIHVAARALNAAYELIVVNDASTDRTGEIAARGGARVVNVDLRHIAAVRNAGAAASSGDFLIFVDADTLVNTAVVAAALDAFFGGAAGGGARVVWEGPMPLWARGLEKLTTWTMRVGKMPAGCFVFCTRRAFDRIGGFDTRLFAAEEIAFGRAMKRIGRFVLLRQHVTTSGRKLRTYTSWELLRMMGAMSLRGIGGLRDRRNLPLWYGERRHDK